MKLKIVILSLIFLTQEFYHAQNFKLMRYDEDYYRLKDSAKTFYNKIKYIPLSRAGNAYLSLGGEIRGELDYAVNEDWGKMNTGTDIFVLQRYHLHTDLHLGKRIRVFGQLRSGLEDGRKNGPRGIDEDQLNVQNLFVDIVPFKKSDQIITLRLGRQEIQYGSGRLIDVREGPNLRLYFDGARVAYASSNLKLDAFVMADAVVNTGVFDNASTHKANLWGVYGTYISPKKGNLDFYYLGINRSDAVFDEGVKDESRHTVGARAWRNGDYLSDALRSLTGQSAQQHIHDKIIEKAKEYLATSTLTVSEIAFSLGFERPQSFNKLFKNKTEMSPLEFRQAFN